MNGCLKGKMVILEDLNFTIEEKKIKEKLEASIETNWKMEQAMKKLEEEKRIEEEKKILEQSKMKTDATRMKMKKIKRHAIEREMHLRYAFGAIVILFVTIVAMYGLSMCTR